MIVNRLNDRPKTKRFGDLKVGEFFTQNGDIFDYVKIPQVTLGLENGKTANALILSETSFFCFFDNDYVIPLNAEINVKL